MTLRQWLTLAGWVAACVAVASASEPLDEIVAVVNNAPITRVQVEREAARLRQADVPAAEAPQLALEALIDRNLQLQRVELAGVTLNEDMIEQRLAALPAELGLKDAEALRAAVPQRFLMTYDEFRTRVREDMLIQALFYREVFLRTEVYESEVEQFLKLEAGVGQQREYRLRHILLRAAPDDDTEREQQRTHAQALRQQVLEGVDFAALARTHSQGELAAGGGALGWESARTLSRVFAAAVQNLVPGEVSEVIATPDGFHLLKLEEVRGGELNDTVRRFRLAHVFMPPSAAAQAQQVWRGIKNQADFLRAVNAHSTDHVSKPRGGEIGWFSQGDVPSYFAEALANMQPGQFSAPISSPFGWHILLLLEEDVEQVDLERLRQQARELLRERRALAQRDVWMQNIRAAAHVRVLDPAFQDLGR